VLLALGTEALEQVAPVAFPHSGDRAQRCEPLAESQLNRKAELARPAKEQSESLREPVYPTPTRRPDLGRAARSSQAGEAMPSSSGRTTSLIMSSISLAGRATASAQ
jgi:hypothetical protein